MDTKNSNSRQVFWAKKLFYYHFRIDYCQSKAHEAADTPSRQLQQNAKNKATLRAKNNKIPQQLQTWFAKVLQFWMHSISFFYYVIICGTLVMPQMHQFRSTFYKKLLYKQLYAASIRDIRLRLPELQNSDPKVKELRKVLAKS